MADATEEFFTRLADRGHEPLLEKVTGTVAFHLAQDKRDDDWLVTIDHGRIGVRHGKPRSAKTRSVKASSVRARSVQAGADSLISTDRSLFDQITTGQANALAAVLRGAVKVDGDLELLVHFQRIFPGRPAVPARRPASSARRA